MCGVCHAIRPAKASPCGARLSFGDHSGDGALGQAGRGAPRSYSGEEYRGDQGHWSRGSPAPLPLPKSPDPREKVLENSPNRCLFR